MRRVQLVLFMINRYLLATNMLNLSKAFWTNWLIKGTVKVQSNFVMKF